MNVSYNIQSPVQADYELIEQCKKFINKEESDIKSKDDLDSSVQT